MDATTNPPCRSSSIKLWPPSQRIRQMLVKRMTKNLSNPTIFIRKYGSLSKEEAAKDAEHIEDVAFSIANQHYEKEPDGDGSSAVQLYAKKCNKLILEALKADVIFVEKKVPSPNETVLDISKGERASIEAEEALELLRPLKEPGNFYTKICFSKRSFDIGAARIAEYILASIKDQLKEVDLSDLVEERPNAEDLDVMSIFSAALEGSALKSLNLSDNALGEKGVRAFGKLLQSQTSLEELYLMNDEISEEAARAFRELVPSTEKLRVLHLHNNMFEDEGAVAISEVVRRSSLLEDFRCSSSSVRSKGGIALSEALGNCSHLKKLDLRDNMFHAEAGIALSKALATHLSLSEIYLSNLNLEDEGAIAIANALKDSAPSLGVLEMAGNRITSEAAPALAACIAVKQSLTKLNLAKNHLRDDGVIQISKALQEDHDQLREVHFIFNPLTRVGAMVAAQSVVNKTQFKLLNLNWKYIFYEDFDELKEIFKESLDRLGPLDEIALNPPQGPSFESQMSPLIDFTNGEDDYDKRSMDWSYWSEDDFYPDTD